MAGYGKQLVLDWSAYARYLMARDKGAGSGRLSDVDRERFEEAVMAGELFVCEPFRMEALYSAQSPTIFGRFDRTLDAFPQAPSGPDLLRVAMGIQKALARARGASHRVKFADLLIAAVAHENDIGVLHYDKDYETIRKHGGIGLVDVWIAKRGSIN